MTTQEILNGNKLIAEFMGWKVVTGDKIKLPYKNHYFGINPRTKRIYNSINSEDYNECWTKVALYAKYNSSWDRLMPVVDKIEQSSINIIGRYEDVIINGCSCLIHLIDDDIVTIGTTKQEAVFLGVVEYIKWYNKNKSKSI